MSADRFRLMQDLNGRWYLVAHDKKIEFLEWTLNENWDPERVPRDVCRRLPETVAIPDITFEKVTY